MSSVLAVVYQVSMLGLSIAAALVLTRLVRGPTTADRVVALDTVLLILVGALSVRTAQTGEPRFIILIIAVSLLGFVATVAAARFIERTAGQASADAPTPVDDAARPADGPDGSGGTR